ncbi:MAG TPA: hypothetical protein VMA36_17735 [Candidatus Limnocylindria bacterium]|jgi:hypothetical protein|nr:hypothetical protein [Candidatus Limnocylindria bacterium]
MIHDDDALDRMLAALPLEEPPASLHARILAATVEAPPVLPVSTGWELWVIATLAAVAVWLSWLVVSSPHATERATDEIIRVVQAGGLTSLSTLLWLAIGGSAAWWITQMSIPSRRADAR